MIEVVVSRKLPRIAVGSYGEAAQAVRAYIEKTGKGASEWYSRDRGGDVYVDGVQVAFVSYNGRVWKGRNDGKLGHEEIV